MNGQVRQERSFWRDEGISQRHRKWGFDCPAVDLDFLLLEYDNGEPVAIIEYKQEHAATQWASHPSYRAIISLGTSAAVAVFAVRYSSDYLLYRVTPLNPKASQFMSGSHKLSEPEFVALLYQLRGREMPPNLLEAEEL